MTTTQEITPHVPSTSYFAHGSAELRSLAKSLGHVQVDSMLKTLRLLFDPWGNRRVGDLRGWRSDVADDGTPYEMSVAFSEKAPEIRVLVEAQGESSNVDELWRAGRDLSQRLKREFGAHLGKLHEVEELFTPRDGGRMALWHAAAFEPERAPQFKVYLDAQAQGKGRAWAVAEEALWRLGYKHGGR